MNVVSSQPSVRNPNPRKTATVSSFAFTSSSFPYAIRSSQDILIPPPTLSSKMHERTTTRTQQQHTLVRSLSSQRRDSAMIQHSCFESLTAGSLQHTDRSGQKPKRRQGGEPCSRSHFTELTQLSHSPKIIRLYRGKQARDSQASHPASKAQGACCQQQLRNSQKTTETIQSRNRLPRRKNHRLTYQKLQKRHHRHLLQQTPSSSSSSSTAESSTSRSRRYGLAPPIQ